jgi:hypothetical protein
MEVGGGDAESGEARGQQREARVRE